MPAVETRVVFDDEAQRVLADGRGCASVFGRPEWVQACWAHLPTLGRPAALVVRADGAVRSTLALSVQDARIGLAAAPLGDRYDLSGPAVPAEVAEACLATLEAAAPRVVLDAIDPGSMLRRAALARAGWSVGTVPSPVLPLPVRRSRHADRRVRRLARDGAVVQVQLSSPGRSDIDALWDQRADTWRHTGRLSELAEVERSLAHRRFLATAVEGLAARGLARIEVLRHGGSVLAQDLYLGPADRPMLYLRAHDFARRSYSPGAVLLSLCLARFAAAGVAELDLGRGDEPYKFALGAQRAHVVSLTYPSPSG